MSPAGSLSDDIRALENSVNEREVELEKDLSRYSGEQLEQMTDHKEILVAAYTLQQAATIPVSGTVAQQLAAIGDEVTRVTDDSKLQQDRIRERSDVVRFFVGGDRTAATALDRDADRLQTQINLMEQLLLSKDVPDELKSVIRDQLQVVQAERDHLQIHATTELGDKGLFGGWVGS